MAGCNPVLTCSLGCRFLPHWHSPGTQTPPCPAYPPPLPYNMHRHTICPLQASPLHMGLASPDLCWWTQGQDRALGRQPGVRAAALLWLVSPGRFQLCFSPGLPSGRGSLHRDSHLPAPVLSPGSCRAAEIRRVLSSSWQACTYQASSHGPPLPSLVFPVSLLPLGPAGPSAVLGITIGDWGLQPGAGTTRATLHISLHFPWGLRSWKRPRWGVTWHLLFRCTWEAALRFGGGELLSPCPCRGPASTTSHPFPGQMAATSCSSLEYAQVHGQGLSRSCPRFNSSQQSKTSVRQIFCVLHALAHAQDGKLHGIGDLPIGNDALHASPADSVPAAHKSQEVVLV